jgi:Lipoprotein confined to pathogenic Mycobacterium
MTNSSSAARTGFLCAATVALTLALAGCHVEKPYEATPSTEAAKALQDLKSLPSFEDTKAQVQAAMAEITAGAHTLVPSITWQTFHEGSSGNCDRPYEQTNGRDYFFPDQVAVRAAISEEDWAKILQMAKDSAAKIGATDIQVMKNQPGNHDVWLSGPAGIFIKVGYQGNLVVSGYTGCRLPR